MQQVHELSITVKNVLIVHAPCTYKCADCIYQRLLCKQLHCRHQTGLSQIVFAGTHSMWQPHDTLQLSQHFMALFMQHSHHPPCVPFTYSSVAKAEIFVESCCKQAPNINTCSASCHNVFPDKARTVAPGVLPLNTRTMSQWVITRLMLPCTMCEYTSFLILAKYVAVPYTHILSATDISLVCEV